MARFVIRPGETSYDPEHRVQGTLDLPLSAHGRDQLDEIVQRLAGQDVEMIYSSPTEPALSTAEYLADVLDVPCRELEQLANVHMGLWQGLTWEEIRKKQPRVFRRWEDAPESVCPPQGETCSEAYERVFRALLRPMKRIDNFAVVAPEPLASIVSCVLRQTPFRIAEPLGHHCLIEEIAETPRRARSPVGRWLGL